MVSIKKMPTFDISEISSNKPTVVIELVDNSGSMEPYIDVMPKSLKSHQKEILKLDEVNSIRFLRIDFSQSIKSSNYEHMEEFSTKYDANGGTALYAAIWFAAEAFFYENGIYEAFIEAGKEPNVILVCFSDGVDQCSESEYGINLNKAKKCVERFNEIGATTAFVAFNQGEEIGTKLGFQASKSYENSEGLTEAFDAISRSVTITSKSKVNLGKNFFDDV